MIDHDARNRTTVLSIAHWLGVPSPPKGRFSHCMDLIEQHDRMTRIDEKTKWYREVAAARADLAAVRILMASLRLELMQAKSGQADTVTRPDSSF